MNYKRIGNAGFFVAGLFIACVWLPRNGFAEDQSAGFYAGPLSVVVEAVVEKAKPASEKNPQLSNETIKRSREVPKPNKERLKETDEESPLSSPS